MFVLDWYNTKLLCHLSQSDGIKDVIFSQKVEIVQVNSVTNFEGAQTVSELLKLHTWHRDDGGLSHAIMPIAQTNFVGSGVKNVL